MEAEEVCEAMGGIRERSLDRLFFLVFFYAIMRVSKGTKRGLDDL